MIEQINNEIKQHILSFEKLKEISSVIETVSKLSIECLKNGGKIILFGNGGSAADAQHIAAELVGRYKLQRRGLSAIALTTDTSALTAIGNDFGYESVFKRQLEALLKPDDLVIGISTSGNSESVVSAIKYASSQNVKTIGMTGKSGGKLNNLCSELIKAPSDDTARIQEMHIFIGHTICHLIDLKFVN